jgi:hypothetical protein
VWERRWRSVESARILSGYAGSWAIGFRGSASFFGLIATAMLATLIALAVVRRHVLRGDWRGLKTAPYKAVVRSRPVGGVI